MRKIILTIGKIIISIILIIIIKILVHYFIFPSSRGYLGGTKEETNKFFSPDKGGPFSGDYHTKLKNPDFIELDMDICSHTYSCTYIVDGEKIHPRSMAELYKKHPKAIKACEGTIGRSLTKEEITYLSSGRYYFPYIYIEYLTWESHVDASISPNKIFNWSDRSEAIKMSDLLEGKYVMSGGQQNLGGKYGSEMKGKLYLFIIPIYILLYWLISKYRKRKKKRA